MTKRLLIVLALCLVPHLASAATYSCSHGVFGPMTSDITLTGSDTVDLIGTAGARCLVLMNSHSFLVANNDTLNGHWKCAYADIFDGVYLLGPGAGGNWAVYSGANGVDSQHCTYHRSNEFRIYASGSGSVTWSYNTWASDFTTPCGRNQSLSTAFQGFFSENGSSTATKFFQGNRIEGCWADLESQNWVVGGASGCTTTCNSDANVLVGPRVGLVVPGGGSYVGYNVLYHREDVTPTVPDWADVESLIGPGVGGTFKNVVNVGGQWQVTSPCGTVQDSLFANGSGHDFLRTGCGGSVHHNIYVGSLSLGNGQRYGSGIVDGTGVETVFDLPQGGNAISLFNNTIDLGGPVQKALVSVLSGATLTSFRSNVTNGLVLNSGTCPGTTRDGCSEALNPGASEGFTSPEPQRVGYSDYNDTVFAASSSRKVVYGLRVSGTTVCDNHIGQHDLGMCNGQGSAPLFKGTRPIGAPYTSAGATTPAFPFDARDFLSGRRTPSDALTWARWVYAPSVSSPLLSAQDPADGVDHMGAVRIADIPGSEPAIHSTNKAPAVWAGVSFTAGTSTYGSDTGHADLVGAVADDGLPSGTLTVTWSQILGPGSATFDHSDRVACIATLPSSGTYIFRLTATDGSLTAWADVDVTKP